MKKCIQITIDGPSASGKSTVAKHIARKLGFIHLDTGAIYRAIALYFRNKNLLDADDETQKKSLSHFSYYFMGKLDDKHHFLDGVDVTDELRCREVSNLSSKISMKEFIRDFATKMQRVLSEDENIVVEGRDTGSVVFPSAKLKFYLDADPIERARRRFSELKEKRGYESLTKEEISEDITCRDARDFEREVSPLICPEGATRIDTTKLDVDQIVGIMLEKAKHQEYKKSHTSRYFFKYKGKKCSFFYLLLKVSFWFYFKTFHRYQVYGLENFHQNAPGIIACNHVSLLDPALVGLAVPEVIHSLGKKALFGSKITRYLLSKSNSYPVSGKAEDKDIMKKVITLLLKGQKVLIFPEGTRTNVKGVQPLRKGLSMFADRGNAPTIPVAVIGTDKALPKGAIFPRLFKKVKVAFGSPISFVDILEEVKDKKKAREVYLERVRNEIQSLIDKYQNV